MTKQIQTRKELLRFGLRRELVIKSIWNSIICIKCDEQMDHGQ